MFKRTIIAVAIAMSTSAVYATNKPHNKPVKPPVSKPVSSTSNAGAVAAAAQLQGQAQIQGQTTAVHTSVPVSVATPVTVNTAPVSLSTAPVSTSVGVSTSPFQNNTQTTNINEAAIPTKTEVKVRNTGDAMGYAAPPSAVCALTGGAGMAVPGFGASVSGSSVDKGCEARENARMLAELGQEYSAIRVLCRNNEDVAREMDICGDIVKLHDEKARRSTAPASNFGIVN